MHFICIIQLYIIICMLKMIEGEEKRVRERMSEGRRQTIKIYFITIIFTFILYVILLPGLLLDVTGERG